MKANVQIKTHTPRKANIGLLGSIAAVAGLLFGFDTGVISGAQEFIFKTFDITGASLQTGALKGFIVASVPMGAFFGALTSGFFAERLGRQKGLIFTALLFVIGALLTAVAPNIECVVFGRTIMGFAIGISAMIAPMYLSEISPAEKRGAIIFLFQLAITIGIFASFTVNYFFAQWETDFTMNWRWMFAVALVPSAILFFGMLRMPNSPRWLVLKKREEEAKATLRYLLGKQDVTTELNEIHESVARKASRLTDLFKKPLLPLLGIAFALFVFQQLTGINAIIYYGPSVFAGSGFGEDSKFIAQMAIGFINMVSTVFGVWVVDRWGRRSLLFTGMIGMISCLFLLGSLLNGFIQTDMNPTLSFLSVMFFIVSFAVSMGGVPYIMMSEIFPLKARAAGMAIASCANWAFNFMVSQSFDMLQGSIGMGNTFFLYGSCTAVGLVFAYMCLPETKSRPLEEIEENLYAGKRMRYLGESVKIVRKTSKGCSRPDCGRKPKKSPIQMVGNLRD